MVGHAQMAAGFCLEGQYHVVVIRAGRGCAILIAFVTISYPGYKGRDRRSSEEFDGRMILREGNDVSCKFGNLGEVI
jgi:hypothetical protein